MFTPLDADLYRPICEVAQITPHRSVYLIWKNASTSLRQDASRIYVNEEIQQLKEITVFIRDPIERLASGMRTVVKIIHDNNRDLDKETIVYFLQKYLYIDSHMLPQFNYLVKLQKYAASDTIYKFIPIRKASEYLRDNTHLNKSIDNQYLDIVENLGWDSYLQLDTVLYYFAENEAKMYFNDIMKFLYNDKDSNFTEMVEFTESIVNHLRIK